MMCPCLNELKRERFYFFLDAHLIEEVTSSGFGENVYCSCRRWDMLSVTGIRYSSGSFLRITVVVRRRNMQDILQPEHHEVSCLPLVQRFSFRF